MPHDDDAGGYDSRPLLRLRASRPVSARLGRAFEDSVEVTDDRGAAQRLLLPTDWLTHFAGWQQCS